MLEGKIRKQVYLLSTLVLLFVKQQWDNLFHLPEAPFSHWQMGVTITIASSCLLLSWCHALFKKALHILTHVVLVSAKHQ